MSNVKMSDIEALIWKKKSSLSRHSITISALALAACGSGEEVSDGSAGGGASNPSKVPERDYNNSQAADKPFDLLAVQYRDPYWVSALEMDQYQLHIGEMLDVSGRVIGYVFPETQPTYEHFEVIGWQPASPQMKTATRQILDSLSKVINVSFVEVESAAGLNVISVARSHQATTSGLSFLPNNFYGLGMDVFISTQYASPSFKAEGLTNHDYETLVHEIGHSLGLKHPFEANGMNAAVLNSFEDQSLFTVMSYDTDPITFDGTFRPLDLMTLTKFYGVNPEFNASNNSYSFSSSNAVFIVDGAGSDTIDTSQATMDAYVDLRPGSHSYLGAKSQYITSPYQMTISHGTNIENVRTGSGDDLVVATDFDNVILTGGGDDMIYAGGGRDIVDAGPGFDQIDLSELIQNIDMVIPYVNLFNLGFDTIYGFDQGRAGDVIDLSKILTSSAQLLQLMNINSVPSGDFSGHVLPIVGERIDSSKGISEAFATGGVLENLSLSNGSDAIIISAASQATGEDQNLFFARGGETIQVVQIAQLQGSSLDIDQWHVDNFNFIA